MLIDTIHAPGGVVELGVLATDFLDGPPQRFNICDVSWVRSDEAFEAAASPDPWARRRVRYRSTTPITSGFLRYLDYVLTYPYAARRLAVQPIVEFVRRS